MVVVVGGWVGGPAMLFDIVMCVQDPLHRSRGPPVDRTWRFLFERVTTGASHNLFLRVGFGTGSSLLWLRKSLL